VKLENGTPLAAKLFSGAESDTSLGCAVLIKATYAIREGRLEPVTEAAWPIHLEPLETPWGKFPGELASRKPKTDVIVLGKAKAPNGGSVRQMKVSLAVGTFRHSLAIFGDRTWERTAAGLRATEPLPFREMPITWPNAFGGIVPSPTFDLAHPYNPAGKGFVLDEKDAEGVALPNVEDPGNLVRAPKDVPRTAGWGPYPIDGGVRVEKLVDERGELLPFDVIEPWVMGWAHPDLIIDTPPAGAPIEVAGVTGAGPLTAAVPALPARVSLVLDEEIRLLEPRLDTLIVEAEERRLVARWRAAATFEMRPRAVRLVRIEAA
jgi:hypothetical protein